MSKKPEYHRFTEFGASLKPKGFLKGFLKKGISARLEVDHREAFLGKMSDKEVDRALKTLRGKPAAGGIATTEGGTMWPTGALSTGAWSRGPYSGTISTGTVSTSGSTIFGTGTVSAVGSGWYGGSLGSIYSRVWTYEADDLTEEQRVMVMEAICAQIRA